MDTSGVPGKTPDAGAQPFASQEGSPAQAAITRVNSHMGEVYERIQNLQESRDMKVARKECCLNRHTSLTKAPLAAAAEAVAAVVPYSADSLKDGNPARCRLSFRFAVMMAILASVLISCLCMFVPFQVVTSEIHAGILKTVDDSVNAQQNMINGLVTANVTKSFEDILAALEQMVQHCVKEPATSSTREIWNSLRGWNNFWDGWSNGRNEHDRTIIYHRSYIGFVDAANFTCKYGFDTPTRWDKRKIRGSYAAQLMVGFDSGDYTSTEMHFYEGEGFAMRLEDGASLPNGGRTAVRRYQLDTQTGKILQPLGAYNMSVAEQPWYKVQEDIRREAGSSELRAAWSSIYGSGKGHSHYQLGIAYTKPIAYCGDYSCFSGVVAFKVALAYLDAACEDLFHSMQNMLLEQYGYRIGTENSSVFIVSHKSRDKSQQGKLIGLSNQDLSSFNASALPHAEESNQALVRWVAKAVKIKFGSWDAPALENSSQLFAFKTKKMKSTGNLSECADWASRALNKDCQQVATISVALDRDTSWLVVVTLPAGVFTMQMAELTRQVQDLVTLQTGQVKVKINEALMWAIVAFVLAATLASGLGLILGWFVTRPLQRLARLMRRLGDLDFAHNSAELNGLRNGTHSWVKEVGKLQKAFCRLSRGIELFSRFVPEAVVRNIVRGESWATRLHVTNRVVTIMFSDIRDFTSISEKLSQRDLLFVITRYLSVMTRIVELYNGVVSEVQGDGLLVLWNTPDDVEDHASMACAAALAQQQALALLNEDFARQGLPPLAIRIGLNTGSVMTGNLGSFTKMRFGCLGDPINLASRLEGLCKYYGVGIICSGATFDMLPTNSFICRKLDLVQVKGRKEPTRVYEVVACQCWHPEPSNISDEGAIDLEAGTQMPPIASSLATPLELAKEVVACEQRVSRDKIRWWRPWKHLKGLRNRTTSSTSKSSGLFSRSELDSEAQGDTPTTPGPITPGGGEGHLAPMHEVVEAAEASESSGSAGSESSTRCCNGEGCPACAFGSAREKGVCHPRGCQDREHIRLYEEALEAFQQAQFMEAVSLLDEFLEQTPDDLAAQGLRQRVVAHLNDDGTKAKSMPIEDLATWTGVNVMTDK